MALLATAVSLALAGEAEDQFAIAADHYSRGRWQDAVDEFSSFLAQSPNHAKADDSSFFLAEALVQLGQYGKAHETLGEFLQKAPRHRFARQALFRSGETAYLSENYPQAKRDLLQFHRAYPDDSLNAYALLYLGEIALRGGDAAGAQESFQNALQRVPTGPIIDRCRFGLARSLELQGDLHGALRFYHLLAEMRQGVLADKAQLQRGLLYYNNQQYSEAAHTLQTFQTTFAESPLKVQAGYWLGMSYMAQQQWNSAIQTFVRGAPEDPLHELAADMEFATAQAMRRAGKPEADRHYERVTLRWPDSPWADDALWARIEMAFQGQRYELVDTLSATFHQTFSDSSLQDDVLRFQGRSLLKREQYERAATLFEKLAESRPESSSNHYYLSLAYLGTKRYRECLAALEIVEPKEDQDELTSALLVARSAALIGLERYADAVTPLQEYLAHWPEAVDAPACRARLAIALAQTDQFNEARLAYNELTQRHSGQLFVLKTTDYLAETAYIKGQRQWAQELFTQLTRQENPDEFVAKGQSGLAWMQLEDDLPEQSAETFARLLQEHPESPLAAEAALMRASALQQLERNDAALAMYGLVIEKHPQSKQAPKAMLAAARLHDSLQQENEAAKLYERLANEYAHLPNHAAVLYQWAWTLLDLGRGDQAESIFERIVADHPKSRYWGDAVYRLAQRAAQTKDYDRAKVLLQRLTQSNPSPEILVHALYLKGQLAVAEKQWQTVGQSMLQLLDTSVDSPLRLQAEYWVAEAAYRQRDYSQATERFDALARKIPGRDAPWLAMVFLRQSQLLGQLKNWQEAYDVANPIAEKFPNFKQQYEVDYLLGRCLSSRGEFDVARDAYEKVIRSTHGGSSETSAMAQWMIGETYFHQKRFDEAIKAYHRVESLYDYPRWQGGALLQAGKCREMKGQWSAAIQLYTQVLKEYGDTTFSDEASRRLRVATQRAAMVATPN